MIGWLILGTYVVGWFPSAVTLTRWIATRPLGYCHGRARGSFRSICRQYDGPDCWRSDPDGTPSIPDALIASAVSLVWPFASLVLVVLHFAASNGHAAPSRLLSEADLDRMERDLGIGGKS